MLEVRPINASEVVLVGSEALYEWREKHRLAVPGHEFMPRFKKGHWDGTWVPGQWCRQVGEQFEMRCSRGLVPRIVKDLGGAVTFPGVDPAVVEAFCARTPKVAALRDYQAEVFRAILREGWGRAALATNAGKGAVIGLLCAFAAEQGWPVLVLCDEIAVFDALQGEIEEWGEITAEVVRAGVREPPPLGVTLAMVPSLTKRLSDEDGGAEWMAWVRQHKMLLLDEGDKANAPTWRLILGTATGTQYRAGFSGTFATDLFADLHFDELMGPTLARVKNKTLVERGVSARPSIEVHSFEDTESLFPLPHDWRILSGPQRRNFVYERLILYNARRHTFVASLVRPDTPTAIIVNRVDHGRDLTATIPGAVFLDGSVSDVERVRVLEEFREGHVKVVVVTKILDRGTNRLGSAADLIFASSEGSPTQTLQRIGRGLRRAGGKEFLRLVDVVDRVVTDLVDDRRLLTAAKFLHGAARRRLQVYGQEGFEMSLHNAGANNG